MSKNKLYSFSHKLAQPSSYMFLPRQIGGDGNQQENNLKKMYRVMQQQLCQTIAEIYVELYVGWK